MVVMKKAGMWFAVAALFVSTSSFAGGRLFRCGQSNSCAPQSGCCQERMKVRVRHRHQHQGCCDQQQQYYAPVSSCCEVAPVFNPGNPPLPPVVEPGNPPVPPVVSPAPAPAPAPKP